MGFMFQFLRKGIILKENQSPLISAKKSKRKPLKKLKKKMVVQEFSLFLSNNTMLSLKNGNMILYQKYITGRMLLIMLMLISGINLESCKKKKN